MLHINVKSQPKREDMGSKKRAFDTGEEERRSQDDREATMRAGETEGKTLTLHQGKSAENTQTGSWKRVEGTEVATE